MASVSARALGSTSVLLLVGRELSGLEGGRPLHPQCPLLMWAGRRASTWLGLDVISLHSTALHKVPAFCTSKCLPTRPRPWVGVDPASSPSQFFDGGDGGSGLLEHLQ